MLDDLSFASNGCNWAIVMVGAGDKKIDGLHLTLVMGTQRGEKIIPDRVCKIRSAFDKQFPTLHCYKGG